MWTWEQLFLFYKALAHLPSYGWRRYANVILPMLPELEALGEKKGLQPRLFMYVVELVAADQDMAVRLILEDSGHYGLQKVSLMRGENLSYRMVEPDALMDTLDALMW